MGLRVGRSVHAAKKRRTAEGGRKDHAGAIEKGRMHIEKRGSPPHREERITLPSPSSCMSTGREWALTTSARRPPPGKSMEGTGGGQ